MERAMELENKLFESKETNCKIDKNAMIIASRWGINDFIATTEDDIIWNVRVIKTDHTNRRMTRMEMLTFFNKLMKIGYEISIK